MAAWERGQLAAAVAGLREAHDVSHCSAYLFVLGELERDAQNDCDALGWYERYVLENPNGEKSAVASQLISELRRRCRTPEAKLAPPSAAVVAAPSPALVAPPAQPPPPSYWTTARIGGWSSLGLSALLGAGAAYFAIRAHDAAKDYEQLWNAAVDDPAQVSAWQQHRSELEQRGASSATTARILGGSAAALAVGGTLLLLFNPGADPAAQDMALSLQPGGVSVRYGTRF
ncbi:MAG: hypothetical protein QM756_08095 [Polyangiaceae bacterium]